MPHIRSLKLVTRLDEGCPWTVRFLRPPLKRATALEHLRLDVTMRDLVVYVADGLKPNADATQPAPVPVLRSLYVDNAIFNWMGPEPQSIIFENMLQQRAQRHLGPQKLKLTRCQFGDGTWAARWRTFVKKVIWDGYGTNIVGDAGDETSDWAISDEKNVSEMLQSREDEDDDW